MKQGAHDDAMPRLREAWPLLLRLGRTDGLAFVGQAYGNFLIAAGEIDEAAPVLRTCAAAFRTLGRADDAVEIEATIDSISD